ncbi:unnamed protein product, partial [Timema podura]|nr:unnamed protein product [Timema podura]
MGRTIFYEAKGQEAIDIIQSGMIKCYGRTLYLTEGFPVGKRRLPLSKYNKLKSRILQIIAHDLERIVYFEFDSDDIWAVKQNKNQPLCNIWMSLQNIFLCGIPGFKKEFTTVGREYISQRDMVELVQVVEELMTIEYPNKKSSNPPSNGDTAMDRVTSLHGNRALDLTVSGRSELADYSPNKTITEIKRIRDCQKKI